MINLASASFKTLANVPHYMAVCIDSLKVRIAEIVRQIFSYCFNRSQDGRNLSATANSATANSATAVPLNSIQQSINHNGWNVMSAFLKSGIKTFQLSVPDFLIHFAKVARGASEDDQAKLGKALDMPNTDWTRDVLKWEQNLINDNSEKIKHYAVTVLHQDVELREKEEGSLKFSDPQEGVKLVNNWVNNKTQGEIPTLIEDLDADTKIVFLTASIFQSKWKYPFNRHYTEESSFTNSDGRTIELQMMKKSTWAYRFASQGGMDIVELPFEGDAFSLLIFLPTFSDEIPIQSKAKASLEAFKNYFNKTKPAYVLKKLNSKLQKRKLNIRFPKKVLEFNTDFLTAIPKHEAVKIVKNIDVRNLATNIDERVVVKEMYAKTKVEWNEEEMKATQVQMSRCGAESYTPPTNFFVNRPYAWMVVSKEKKMKKKMLSTIFFMGVVGDLEP